MPTYQYRCTSCGTDLEIFQKFTDDALTVCPECEGQLRKVFNAVGVVFKGSGFYATDNRTKGKTAASVPAGGAGETSGTPTPAANSAGSGKGEAGSGSGSGSGKGEAKKGGAGKGSSGRSDAA